MPLSPHPLLLQNLPSLQKLLASKGNIPPSLTLDEESILGPRSRVRYVIVRDDAEKKEEIVGLAVWGFFRDDADEDGDGDIDSMPSALEALWGREGAVWGRRCASPVLSTLLISPTSQHPASSITTLLIRWGLDHADAHNLPTYLSTTPADLPLYLTHGFRKADTTTTGKNNVQEPITLVRPAQDIYKEGEVVITPYLTNANFETFEKIEEAAFQPAAAPKPSVSFNKPNNRLGEMESLSLPACCAAREYEVARRHEHGTRGRVFGDDGEGKG
ncbi:MAG: hypothetical protein Q9164_003934 [Protoblastenia rupestris]